MKDIIQQLTFASCSAAAGQISDAVSLVTDTSL
jgi:hypothetical protein